MCQFGDPVMKQLSVIAYLTVAVPYFSAENIKAEDRLRRRNYPNIHG
jgi:hypothetical protein